VAAEADVREALRSALLAAATDRPEVVDEFWVPCSHERADVAVIGNWMEAFEIKTDQDRLTRLPRQIGAYGRLFDRCTAVVAERHLREATAMIPEWWGVLVITTGESIPFESVRSADVNESVDAATLVRLLWRGEVSATLTRLGAPPEPGAARSSMWDELLRHVDLGGLRTIVRQALRSRDPARARFGTRRLAPASITGTTDR
jgi:hypothetical protein